MDIQYRIEGYISVPDDAVVSGDQLNLIVLADGQTISVQPVVELNTGINDDNHRNLNYREAEDAGVIMGDYERETNISKFILSNPYRSNDIQAEYEEKSVATEDRFPHESIIKLTELKIGDEFVYRGMTVKNRITDIGTRTITYISLDQSDERNYNGPPYSIQEHSLGAEELGAIDLIKKD